MNELKDEILHLPLNLYRTAIAIRGELSRKLTLAFGEEFTVDYWFVLSALFEHGNLEQTQLAGLVNRNTASISRTLSCMERLDLVIRKKEKVNSRSTTIATTKLAQEFKPTAEDIISETLKSSLGMLKPIEILEFNRILSNIFTQCQHQTEITNNNEE